MSDVRYVEVSGEEAGQRLDNYLFRILKGVPKSHVYRMIRGGEVRINKKRAQVSSKLCLGDLIRIPPVRMAEEKSEVLVTSNLSELLKTCTIYEDEHLLVINKPSGLAVHGGSGLSFGLIEALRQTRPDIHYLELVHRLDKETSGCILLAKKRRILREIQAMLANRTIEKTYWAILAHRWVGKQSVVVNAALQKNILQSGERVVKVNSEGKASETHIKLLENFRDACWVEARPKTGRTHQIRVHVTHIGHPILGDKKYTDETSFPSHKQIKPRLYLHARAIEFILDGKQFSFSAELDEKFSEALKVLGSID